MKDYKLPHRMRKQAVGLEFGSEGIDHPFRCLFTVHAWIGFSCQQRNLDRVQASCEGDSGWERYRTTEWLESQTGLCHNEIKMSMIMEYSQATRFL